LKSLKARGLPVGCFYLIEPRHLILRGWGRPVLALLLAAGWLCLAAPEIWAQSPPAQAGGRAKKVLLIFSEGRDLPGTLMLEQSVRSELLKSATPVECFTESLDAGHSPSARHFQVFRDYLQSKYAGQNLDLVLLFLSRDYQLARDFPLREQVPLVLVSVGDLPVPSLPAGRPFTGIFQRFDVEGTLNFIFRLQPETRRVVVLGGTSLSDQALLLQIGSRAESVAGVDFEFWTNRPATEVYQDVRALSPGTVILMGTLHQDVVGQPAYTAQTVQMLAPAATVPVYVLGAGVLGTGALGGSVADFDKLGRQAGGLALRVLGGTPVGQIPVEQQTNGLPMADWRALERWHLKKSRLPAGCLIQYEPQTLWQNHWRLIVLAGAGLLAQAVTIAALLFLRRRQQLAEAEILRQRTELAHVSRVSVMGQLASALTHELNQPLGAILRNAEAAEIYLQSEHPNLEEVRAILTDIRRDDKRAGNVIDGMRSLFKRQKLASTRLDLRDLVEDTIAMARPDASARQVKLRVEIQPNLPAAQGDRVHVQQVLLNLIINGMDAMGIIPKVRRWLGVVVQKTPAGNLQVSVTDCGVGISPDDAVHIFEPFFTTKVNGMGMGLAISRTIIEAHGGELWMESNGMEGTTFTFVLPPAGCEKVKPGDLPAPV